MIRKIIHINEEKCNGCGACASACHEGAIQMMNGKARLTREDYCDGLGDCLPACPTGAISFEEREAPAYNAEAVKRSQDAIQAARAQWPVQIQLVSVNAPFFDGADLLIAADCTAYAYSDFHQEFARERITLIGCPKLDHADYAGKLTQIFANNQIRSVTVVRMQVPCCGGIEHAVKTALKESGKHIPWQVITITTDGNILN